MYPLESSIIIIIVASGIGLSIWWIGNKKRKIISTQTKIVNVKENSISHFLFIRREGCYEAKILSYQVSRK